MDRRLKWGAMMAACACTLAGQTLEDGPSDDLLGPARQAVRRAEERKAAEAAAQAAARAKAEAGTRDQAASLERAIADYRAVRHPRLLATPEQLALIREQIRVPGSHFQLAHDVMVRHLSRPPNEVWGGDPRKGYWPVYVSREAAFLCLVSTNAVEKQRYARMAAEAVPDLNYIRYYGFKSASLAHAMATFGLALTYDWAYNDWTEAERQKVEAIFEYFFKHWETYRRVSEDPAKVSGYNFYGVLYGAQIMLHLAAGREKTSPRFPVCVDVLTRHLAAMGGELGAHNEGIGYTEYPMGFALPAALALAQHGETRPLDAAKTHALWTLNMFVQTFMTSFERKFLQYGVSHRSNGNEGFTSLTLGLCPADVLPHYLWFYDRHMGRLSKAEADRRFDSHRGNAPFAMLLYPGGVVARDPTGVLPKAVMDSDGYVFFRNRWRDEDDIQVALLNPVRRSGGWAQDESLNLRLSAFDTRFFGGPAKEHKTAFYTTLLVDGKHAPAKGGGFVPGRIASFDRDDNGGYAVADASNYYRGLGVTGAVRHLLVHYSKPEENTAILATLDRVDGVAPRTLTWQANLGPDGVQTPAARGEEAGAETGSESASKPKPSDPLAETRAPAEEGVALDAADGPKPAAAAGAGPAPATAKPDDDGILSSQGTEAGRPFFLLKGRRGAVKGWVLHPADAVIQTGDPLQVTTRGKKADIWIVLFAGAGEPPVATATGEGMKTELRLAGRKVTFDGERVRCD